MKILKKYKEADSDWFETTISECIKHTEDCGYYKPGTVLNLLESGNIVATAFTYYKAEV